MRRSSYCRLHISSGCLSPVARLETRTDRVRVDAFSNASYTNSAVAITRIPQYTTCNPRFCLLFSRRYTIAGPSPLSLSLPPPPPVRSLLVTRICWAADHCQVQVLSGIIVVCSVLGDCRIPFDSPSLNSPGTGPRLAYLRRPPCRLAPPSTHTTACISTTRRWLSRWPPSLSPKVLPEALLGAPRRSDVSIWVAGSSSSLG